MNKQEALLVGIDFGSKNIRAAIFYDKDFRIVENSKQWRSTPSILVLKAENDLFPSYENREFWNDGTHNTYSFEEHRRMLCMAYDKSFDKRFWNNFSHGISKSLNNLYLEIENPNETIWKKSPSLICTKLLQRLKSDISRIIGNRNFKVVLSMPESCNTRQQNAIKLAAEQAGLNCDTMITSPNAIVMSYCFHSEVSERFKEHDYLLVYDLGATTLNLALYHVTDRYLIHKLGAAGDLNVGGFDFDTELLRYVINMLDEHRPFDRKLLTGFLKQRLRRECERVKIELSTYSAARFSINIDHYGQFETKITSNIFERLTADLCKFTMKQIDSLLNKCDVTKDEIHHVLVCGGSSSVRQIQRLLYDYFSQCKARFSTLVHRDESVVQGAAMYAAMFSKHNSQFLNLIQIFECMSK